MSLWGRFLGNRRGRACAEGVTLLEQGRYAEAVALLRDASLDSKDHPTGSLISFHFRQALVAQGRDHLRSGEPAEAAACFTEGVRHWDQYPDLHCLRGAALGLSGHWDDALTGARSALRRNPDYAEARLLETLALQKLGRGHEAADSLNALIESGRRVEHWLISGLEGKTRFGPEDLPQDLEALLVNSLSGQSEKEEVAAAVAQCRAGNWQEGLDRFAGLVMKRPRYPDYRTRHAAALFHLGRNDEALAEVEAALALNESYRTAINLKGLILADEGRLGRAREFLAAADESFATGKSGGAHEELFGSYLRGVLALLAGEPGKTVDLLEGWGDLTRNFARAELLLAAAEDLQDRSTNCGRRLTGLAAEWAAEPIYFHLLASHHLRQRRYDEAADVLGRWPVGSSQPDHRPLYLEAILALDQGRVPVLPSPEDPGTGSADQALAASPAEESTAPGLRAWAFLAARVDFLQGEAGPAWQTCDDLVREGFGTEPVVRFQTAAAVRAPGHVPEGWRPETLIPESCLASAVYFGVVTGDREIADNLLEVYRTVHPEQIRVLWLSPSFWLDPVRNWIA